MEKLAQDLYPILIESADGILYHGESDKTDRHWKGTTSVVPQAATKSTRALQLAEKLIPGYEKCQGTTLVVP